MVAMRMRAHDCDDPFAFGRGQDRVDMVCQIRAGIDHRHLAASDDVGLGAGIGEWRRIGRQQAAHQRLQRDGEDRHECATALIVRG
jgi:hypothetical protein